MANDVGGGGKGGLIEEKIKESLGCVERIRPKIHFTSFPRLSYFYDKKKVEKKSIKFSTFDSHSKSPKEMPSSLNWKQH